MDVNALANDFWRVEPPWISTKDYLPVDQRLEHLQMYDDEPEFLVMIEGAILPTVLVFNGDGWYDINDDGYRYDVTHWLPLPNPPRRGVSNEVQG